MQPYSDRAGDRAHHTLRTRQKFVINNDKKILINYEVRDHWQTVVNTMSMTINLRHF